MFVIKDSTKADKKDTAKVRTYLCRKDFSTKDTYMITGILPVGLPANFYFNEDEIEISEEVKITKSTGTKQYFGKITKYSVPRTEKNDAKLLKAGFENLDAWHRAVKIQNMLGLHWDRCYSLAENIEEGDLSDTARVSEMMYQTMSFGTADEKHKEMFNDPMETGRKNAIITMVLAKNRARQKADMTVDEFTNSFRSIEKIGCYECLTCCHRIECLQDRRITIFNGKIVDLELKKAKEEIEAFLNRPVFPLMTKAEIKDCKKFYDNKLSEEQINCIDLLSLTDVSVITGGAGTGKTTVIKAIIESYGRYYGRDYITLVAPTGKASKRMKQQTGFEDCSTIHSKLRKSEDFIYYNEYHKLEGNLIICDEGSMVDLILMRDLLRAIDEHTKVIFVGDHNQLPPVNIGEPFFDFIRDDRVSKQELTYNHRQGENNGILENANALLNGVAFEDLKVFDNFVIRNIAYDEIFEYATDKTLSISPYNEVNAEINKRLRKGKNMFNVNDKVLFLRNVKGKDFSYCNGDTGIVKGTEGANIIIEKDDGGKVVITPKYFDDIDLAYAMTVHKTQGSEYDNVKIFIPKGNKFVTHRMLYTAITRGKCRIGLYFYEPKKTA